MTTLCLALALTCATEAGATTDKQPKLKGRQTAAWSVAVPGSRTQSASAMRFLNMGLGAPLTSSLRHPKILIKEFSYFLMPCHQHGLRINLLV